MNRSSFIPILYCIVLTHFSGFRLAADDPEPSEKIMEIISKTANCSAKIARNKNATEEEKNTDQARRKIGIGEKVTITLTSKKPALLEPKEQIQWTVKKGEELLVGGLTSDKDHPESASFWVSPWASKEQIQNSGGLIIEVSTQQGIALPEPITFQVVFPEQLTAEHETLEGIVKGSPVEGFPPDGSNDPGASALLIVSVHPLDVCYQGIWIIEKNGGYEGQPGSLGRPHNADSKCSITYENRTAFPDKIAISRPKWELNAIKETDSSGKPIYKHTYPNQFTWKCLLRTYDGSDINGISDITTVYQRFYFDRAEEGQFYIRIKKYLVDLEKDDECSVERTSGGNHIFTP